MNKAAIFSFSDDGEALGTRIAECLSGEWETSAYRPKGNLKELCAKVFPSVEAMIFVGACGIAVRAIAPHIAQKTSDPAVIIVDELGINAISLLSGHIGGANELTRKIAAFLGANAVITTATDLKGRFAADVWATRMGLIISDMQAEKRFSAEILRRDLPVASDFPLPEQLPAGLFASEAGPLGLYVTCTTRELYTDTLRLIPKKLHIGIGCRRGVSTEQIDRAVRQVLLDNALDIRAVAAAASIDVKRDEEGLLRWADSAALQLRFYAADQLNALEGRFTASEFVRGTVGVDNVCERSAVLSAGEEAQLIVSKTALGGVTVAVAMEKWSVCFE